MRIAIVLILPLLVALPLLGQEDRAALDRVLADPPATGLLVISVVPESQAAELGILVGDVIVTYNGEAVGSIDELNEQKSAVMGREAKPEMSVVRPGGMRIAFSLDPGSIGVHLIPVEKGVAAEPLPKATGVKFDFSALAGKPQDEWYAFSLDGGETKVGFEHVKLSLVAGKLMLRREVAFDGGEQWGLNHFDVTVVADAGPRPTALATRFLNPLTAWVGTGRLVRPERGGWEWLVKWPEMDPEVKSGGEGTPTDMIPGYLVETLACFMPREKGACYHFRLVEEGMGTISELPSALVAVGEEEIEHDGKPVKVFRCEQRRYGGGVAGIYWVDRSYRIVKVDYGGAQGALTTKEKALANLNEGLVPRSAK